MLPAVRGWLERLNQARTQLDQAERHLGRRQDAGRDLGGRSVEQNVRLHAEVMALLGEFARREIQLRDPDRGLLDFPAMRDGREVFLCWESDDADIGFWHELDAGYAGREPL